MRIVVLDTAASSGGALSILKDFYTYVMELKDGNEWIFIISGDYIQETNNIKVVVLSKVKKNWFKRLQFDMWGAERIIRRLNPDRFVSLQNTFPRGIIGYKMLYVHQPIPFQKIKRFSVLKKDERVYAIYQYIIGGMIKASIKKADCVIVQTDWMKNTIEEFVKGQVKVLRCYPTIKMPTRTSKCSKICDFIYPAAPIKYKNHEIIKASCELLYKKNVKDFNVEFTCNGVDDRSVHYIGNVERDVLFEKYTRCALIFPSYIETFGYPLMEARMVNGLILAADCDYAHELLDGYENAYFFNPFSSDNLAELMEKVICDEISVCDKMDDISKFQSGWSNMVSEIYCGGK